MRPTSPEGEPQRPAGSVIKVLLVDDQRMIGEVVRRLLEGAPDIAFHYCADPAEALVQTNELLPDVILQDLVMPKIDGLDLVRQYRASAATMAAQIIVLSGSDDVETRSRATAAGAHDFMVKLPAKAELLARIRFHAQGG